MVETAMSGGKRAWRGGLGAGNALPACKAEGTQRAVTPSWQDDMCFVLLVLPAVHLLVISRGGFSRLHCPSVIIITDRKSVV